MLLIYTVPAVLGALFKDAITPGDAGDDDPEKLARKLAAEQISFLLGLFVVGREFADVGKIIAGADGARDYAGPAGTRMVGDTLRFGKQAMQGEFDDAFRKAAINLSGDLFGLPAAQVNRTITGAKALVEGETQQPGGAGLRIPEAALTVRVTRATAGKVPPWPSAPSLVRQARSRRPGRLPALPSGSRFSGQRPAGSVHAGGRLRIPPDAVSALHRADGAGSGRHARRHRLLR